MSQNRKTTGNSNDKNNAIEPEVQENAELYKRLIAEEMAKINQRMGEVCSQLAVIKTVLGPEGDFTSAVKEVQKGLEKLKTLEKNNDTEEMDV